MTYAIHVEGLGKRYRLGRRMEQYPTLRDAIAGRFMWRRPSAVRDDYLWALRDLNFDVKEGEVLGVIGANGAGKSTLLKVLSRLTEPTEGRAILRGRVGSLLEVGTGFHPELTGRENIYLNGAVLGMRKAQIDLKFDEIVAFAETERFLDTPVKRYSSGMYVRLAFAVAAHLEPEILVVDEVLAVGDADFQRKCLGRMGSVAREGRTVLFVSHNMGAVKSLCTRAIVLRGGKLVADGTTDQAVAAYLGGGTASGAEGEIPDDVSRIGNGDALLRRVRLSGPDGQPTDQVFFGQPFTVTAWFEARKRIDEAMVEIGISTIEGERVATAFNTDRLGEPYCLQEGLNQISSSFEVDLLPRDYVLDISVHRVSGATLDWVERALRFSALNVAADSGDHYRPSQVRGFIRPRTNWGGPR
jgi:lipopolysaccharide transport system ATP-binding protein